MPAVQYEINPITGVIIPDTYIVSHGAAFALSAEGDWLDSAPMNVDGSIDWANLGPVFDADGTKPHIDYIRALLLAGRFHVDALAECF